MVSVVKRERISFAAAQCAYGKTINREGVETGKELPELRWRYSR